MILQTKSLFDHQGTGQHHDLYGGEIIPGPVIKNKPILMDTLF